MAVLRLVAPLQKAGIRLLQGNQGVQINPDLVSEADLVVIQRDFPRMGPPFEQVLERARRAAKPVIYEVDDLLLDLPSDHSHRQDYEGVLLPILRTLIEADAVTVSTPTLAETLRPFNAHIYTLPNLFNDDLWSLRPPAEQTTAAESEPIVIGYMGGETHRLDLEEITPVLSHLLQRYAQRLRLRFWGGRPPEALLSLPQVEWIPFNQDDYPAFARFFSAQHCHLLIAPLRDNLFNRCKSAIKFLEYCALGAPGVYARLPMYQQVIRHGENGLLAGDPAEWETCLAQLIESPALRRQMAQNAQQTVRERWLLSQNSQLWLNAYQQTLEQGPRQAAPALQPDPTDWRPLLLRVIRQTEAYLQALETRARQPEWMHDFQQSRTWRLAQRIAHLRQRLFPPGSRREQLLRRWIK